MFGCTSYRLRNAHKTSQCMCCIDALRSPPKADSGAAAANSPFVRAAVVQQTQVQRQLQLENRSKPNVYVTGAKDRYL